MSAPELNARALIPLPEARRYVWRNEDDASRDEILVDAVNDCSDSIWDHCHREFKPTTVPGRSGADGVTDGTTTFVAASGAFTATDEGALISITGKGLYRIETVTNGTTVELDGSPATDTDLSWALAEARVFDYDGSGFIDLDPYDLQELDSVVLYTDRPSAQQVALDAANYRLRPTGRSRGGTYLGLDLPVPGVREFDYGFEWQVTVSGFWGMLEVPGAVKLACKQWVENIVKNPGSYAANSMSGYTVIPEQEFTVRRAGMPPSVQHRLERWCRTVKKPLQVIRFAHSDRDAPAIPHRLPTI
jgi:hypothetical protein